ncbi:reticulon-1-A [Drosophila ficusphila]|uniref:reticulon-1-A n=1 Tax=Drosophila ficusphila TaxID=30025 RepID=UPI0007E8B321|nr:reticulon-1-A [Drosophila ficusphila]
MFLESCIILWTVLTFVQRSKDSKEPESVREDPNFENMNSENSKNDEESSQLFKDLKDLLLWRNWRSTLIVFTSVLILLLDVIAHSVISVVSMAGITVVLAAIGHRLIMQFLWSWKRDVSKDHISRLYPQVNIDIPREEAMRLAGMAVIHLNWILNRLLRLCLVEKWEDTLKFLAMLCGINLLGDCFNGLTLLLFAFVLMFTLPKLYEMYKPIVDAQIGKFYKCKQQMEKVPESQDENKMSTEKEYPTEMPNKARESKEGTVLYEVCNNEQLLDLLEEEHRKGCRCRDCEQDDLPIEAH